MSSLKPTCLSRHRAARDFRTSPDINTLDAYIFIDDAFARSVGTTLEIVVSSLPHADHAIANAIVDDQTGSYYPKDRKAFRFLTCKVASRRGSALPHMRDAERLRLSQGFHPD
jgi:hypothetical protein